MMGSLNLIDPLWWRNFNYDTLAITKFRRLRGKIIILFHLGRFGICELVL